MNVSTSHPHQILGSCTLSYSIWSRKLIFSYLLAWRARKERIHSAHKEQISVSLLQNNLTDASRGRRCLLLGRERGRERKKNRLQMTKVPPEPLFLQPGGSPHRAGTPSSPAISTSHQQDSISGAQKHSSPGWEHPGV